MTQELTVYEKPQQEAKSLSEWFGQWVSPEAMIFEITTQDELQIASEALNEIKAKAKTLEAIEKSATSPLNQSLEVIRGWFRPGKKLAAQAEALWKQKILESNNRRRIAAAEAARTVQVELARGNVPAATLAHAKIQPVEVVSGIQTRKRWVATVINPGLVPDAYKVVDMPKVNADMRAQLAMHPNDTPIIPGIRFDQVETLAAMG